MLVLDTEWSEKKTSTRGSDITSADTCFKRAAKPLIVHLQSCGSALQGINIAIGNSRNHTEGVFRFSVVKPNQSNQSGQSEAWENHNERMRNRRKTVGNERNRELPSHDWLHVRFCLADRVAGVCRANQRT